MAFFFLSHWLAGEPIPAAALNRLPVAAGTELSLPLPKPWLAGWPHPQGKRQKGKPRQI